MNHNIKKVQEDARPQHATCESQGQQRSLCLLFPGLPLPLLHPTRAGGSGPAQGTAGAAQPPGTAAMAPRHRRGGSGLLLCSSATDLRVSLIGSWPFVGASARASCYFVFRVFLFPSKSEIK